MGGGRGAFDSSAAASSSISFWAGDPGNSRIGNLWTFSLTVRADNSAPVAGTAPLPALSREHALGVVCLVEIHAEPIFRIVPARLGGQAQHRTGRRHGFGQAARRRRTETEYLAGIKDGRGSSFSRMTFEPNATR